MICFFTIASNIDITAGINTQTTQDTSHALNTSDQTKYAVNVNNNTIESVIVKNTDFFLSNFSSDPSLLKHLIWPFSIFNVWPSSSVREIELPSFFLSSSLSIVLSLISSLDSLSFNKSSKDILYNLANIIRLSVSGDDSALSHLDTACLDIPSLSANSSWE